MRIPKFPPPFATARLRRFKPRVPLKQDPPKNIREALTQKGVSSEEEAPVEEAVLEEDPVSPEETAPEPHQKMVKTSVAISPPKVVEPEVVKSISSLEELEEVLQGEDSEEGPSMEWTRKQLEDEALSLGMERPDNKKKYPNKASLLEAVLAAGR